MAPRIVSCKACEASISAEAGACPHCGHPMQRGRGNVIWWCLLAAAFGLIVFSVVSDKNSAEQKSQQQITSPAPIRTPPVVAVASTSDVVSDPHADAVSDPHEVSSPAQASSIEESPKDKAINKAVTMAAKLRQLARNPDSFVLEDVEISGSDNSFNECLTFRSQNGLGGMVRGRVVLDHAANDLPEFSSDDDQILPPSWSADCAGDIPRDDVTAYVKGELDYIPQR